MSTDFSSRSPDAPDDSPGDGSRRRYDGSGRQRDASLRRARMIEAARELFLEQGYGATSMEQIAQRAGTSAQTVYAAFGNKPGVIRRVIDVAVGGDDEDVKLFDRPEYIPVFETSDLRERVRLLARMASATHRRSGELLCIVQTVAGTDPSLAEMAAEHRSHMRTDAERFLDTIPPDRLRPGFRRDQLLDLGTLLGDPRNWYTLVIEHGWSDEQYAEWLGDALIHALLDAEP